MILKRPRVSGQFRFRSGAMVSTRSAEALEQDQRFTLERDDRWCREKAGVRRWDLDVAACKESHLAKRYFTAEMDALREGRIWKGPNVWANVPFSNIAPWVRRAWQAIARRECTTIGMLMPATRTEQPWWQHDVEPYRDCGSRRLGIGGPIASLSSHFLSGRTSFGHPGNRNGIRVGSPPFTCVLLVFRNIESQTSAGVLS